MRHILLLHLIIFLIASLLALAGTTRSASAVGKPVTTDWQAETQWGAASSPPVPLNARRIATGGSETCAVSVNGIAKCWGWNQWGQLGDGTTTNKPWPTDVVELGRYPPMLSIGAYHACALTAGGGVQCWGDNYYGQLGDDTTTDRLTPTDVVGLSGGTQSIAAGMFHTCALTAVDGVQCWGYNGYAQLGDGTTTDHLTPADVVGLTSEVRAIAAGRFHTCALMASGGVKCWGWNFAGQLGDGTVTPRSTPVDVSGLTNDVRTLITGGDHTCALTATGGVKCWGWNGYGQLGDGTGVSRGTPTDVTGLTSSVQAVTANQFHTCALTTSGTVKCWGYNGQGQLGNGTTTNRLTPTDVTGLPGPIHAIGAGNYHTCALAADDSVWCWGSNASGQLGDGTNTDRLTPVQVVQMPVFDCAAVSEIPQNECLALLALADRANWLGWPNHAGWRQTTTPCSWYGIACQDGHVTGIDLRDNYLSGTAPPELGDLAHLTELNLSGAANALTGPLPAAWSRLTALRVLDLHFNQLSGPVPPAWGALTRLETLDLNHNNLSGVVPGELGQLTALQTLSMRSNHLTGTLPAALGTLSALRDLDLNNNQLSGPIPPELGQLAALEYLDLGFNQLSGPIPPELGQLTSLGDLYLHSNQLSGPIPPELGNLTGFQAHGTTAQAANLLRPPPAHGYLMLTTNRLSGPIPVELSRLDGAAGIGLGCNQLSGPLLPEVGRVIGWGTVDYNRLSGYDPAQYPYWYWYETQTTPPTAVQATTEGMTTTLTWTPIAYTGDGGFYEISSATAPDGPFTIHGQTADKTSGSYAITDLTPGSTAYFRVRTFTPAHRTGCDQQNDLWSDYSAVVSTGGPVRLWLPLVWR